MHPTKASSVLLVLLLIPISMGVAFAASMTSGPPKKPKFTTIYNFGGLDGAIPFGRLIQDKRGNLFGVTEKGGPQGQCEGTGCGTVFELFPHSDGRWTEKILHYFGVERNDGRYPSGQLIFDTRGNLFGAAASGGTSQNFGMIFKLSRSAQGRWIEEAIYNFTGGDDGGFPGELLMDASGNLYGTTSTRGRYDLGTVWELSPRSQGTWTLTLLQTMNGLNGTNPGAGLNFDSLGNIWGTTYLGGAFGEGTVFELTPNGSGGWTYQVIHDFIGKDGIGPPVGRLVFGKHGHVFGMTEYGGGDNCRERGRLGCGTIFGLIPARGGGYTFIEVYQFGATDRLDGFFPEGGLRFDQAGHLYGTASIGGSGRCEGDPGHGCGIVFELVHKDGSWEETVIHNFDKRDGEYPATGLKSDRRGRLHGTTLYGGPHQLGTIYEIRLSDER